MKTTETLPKTVREALETLSASFEIKERTNGDKFTSRKDSAPDWVQDVVREAHSGMFPDDWRYEAISSLATALSEQSEQYEDYTDSELLEALRDDLTDIADGLVDVYTSSLTDWLASSNTRVGYVDEATSEFGETSDITKSLQLGQFAEYQEIGSSLLASLEEFESAEVSS